MRVLSTRTIAEDGARTMQMRLLRTRTMPNEVAKYKNNANEDAK